MNFSILAKASIILASTATIVSAHRRCSENDDLSPVNIVASTADSSDDLKGAFEAFRGLLGGENNGNTPESKPDGHRQINWDAAAVPFHMPGDFFAERVTRGCIITTSDEFDNEFVVSNPPPDSGIHDNRFDSIVGSDLAHQFATFSDERLFSPLNDNEIYINFVDVGNTHKKAKVTGYGAVFTDVDSGRATKMEFLDENGCELLEVKVPPEASGLSFLGAHFGDVPLIATVKITLGGRSVGEANSHIRGRSRDVVVMDDFLYGEPQPY